MPSPPRTPRAATSRRQFLAGAAAALGCAPLGAAQGSGAFLFSYFTGNGEDGLHFARSRDGLAWEAVAGGRSFLSPAVGSRLMRDPSLVQGPDGTFHLVWTTGWWDRCIGVAHSRDLVSWSSQEELPVMGHEPTALNCWAPEIFFDAPTARYLVVWSSTIPGRFPETEHSGNEHDGRRLNHRLYAVWTKDFQTWSPTRLFYDPGFNVIDGVVVRLEGRCALVVKDETQRPAPKKHLRVAFGSQADGPWGAASAPFTPDWVEGPSALRVGESWLVYYDEYTRRRYGAMRTRDFETFEDVSGSLRMPEGMRHGTACVVPADIVDGLERR
jgi:hypothetical protein